MKRGQNDPKGKMTPRGNPQWRFSLGYIVLAILLLWIWQQTFSQMSIETIPYSQFKEYLARGEVVECSVRQDEITGKIQLKAAPPAPAAPGVTAPAKAVAPEKSPPGVSAPVNEKSVASTNAVSEAKAGKTFLFRTVRVDDPQLVSELEKAGVKFTGVRPNFISEFLMAWVLPIGLMLLVWAFIARRMGNAGQSLLSFGKSKARLIADKQTGVTFNDVAGCDEAI
ncbi:MAG: ATP-dependent metallopeptidase FtsH/Yme1/Tma family protein, partial [Candidatus Omnitrophica bacterium]|nr:ATP-dependent metallopeptidase FtsH/Yme1/Tma family protein [Candidatus Omnitrophota bacterium]